VAVVGDGEEKVAYMMGYREVHILPTVNRYQRQLLTAKILGERGCSVTAVCFRQKADEAIRESPSLEIVGMRGAGMLATTIGVLRLLSSRGIRLVVCNDTLMRAWTPLIPVLAATALRRGRLVIEIQDLPVGLPQSYGTTKEAGFRTWVLRLREKLACSAAERVICLNRTMKRILTRMGLPPHRVVSIPRGADNERFGRLGLEGPAARRSLGLAPTDLVVGWYGRKMPHKAIRAELLEAFRLALEGEPSLRLLIVGEGPEWGAIQAGIRELGIGDAATQLGYVPVDGMPVYFSVCDLTATPLKADGDQVLSAFSTKVLDSMAAGKAVVAARTPALMEELGERDALLVEPSDPAGMSDAMSRLARNPKLRRRLGRRGRRIARARLDMGRMAYRAADAIQGAR
jgi:glycosyltransferase involved in cell wall biosynthesis